MPIGRRCGIDTGPPHCRGRRSIIEVRPEAGGRRGAREHGVARPQERAHRSHLAEYLERIGVPDLPPATSPFDPGYDPITVESHLAQSAHLVSILKISMACWQVASEAATRQKIASAKKHGVPTTTGGGPFEVAVAQGQLVPYLDLVAELGVTRIECGEGFTDMDLAPGEVLRLARSRGLEVQFELGKKHGGAFS